MKTNVHLIVIFLSGILLAGCHKDKETNDNLGTVAGMVKIAFASDIHYMAPELLIQDGPAFQAYEAADPKLLMESPDILKQLVVQLNSDLPDLLIIPGDLTKDGELVSHQQVITMLKSQLDSRIKVLVLPGNHDIANPDALSYDGETTTPVPTITESDFATLYGDFGYTGAISRDAGTLSYVAEPYNNLRVIFIDATIRPNPDDPNEPPLEGVITEETLSWIDVQVADALGKNMQIFAVMHHNLIDHWTNQSVIYPGYVINNSAEAAQRLYQDGIQLIFTGHSHANDITRYSGGELYDIETGSSVSYPLPYRFMKYWNNDSLEITTKYIRGIDLHGEPIEDYAQNFLNTGMTNIFHNMLTQLFGVTEPTATQVAELEAGAYVEYNTGDEVLTQEEQDQLTTYTGKLTHLGFPLAAASFNATYTAWNTDLVPQDNSIVLDLRPTKSQIAHK
jgi:3',5'-cyclic AMP phosphodiesterase CpdA